MGDTLRQERYSSWLRARRLDRLDLRHRPFRTRRHSVCVAGERARIRLPAVIAEPEDRAEPFCPYFGTCGGCTLQHLGPAAYTALKTELVESALRQAHIEAGIAPLIEAHGDGRRRATLHARGTAVGYMRARSHELLDITHCPILLPGLETRAVTLTHPIAATIGDCA